MDLTKEVFTTFEVAKICNANITSIKNWIDQGELKSFRTPGGHHRIPREVVDAFLRRHNMPNPFEAPRPRLLVVTTDPQVATAIPRAIGDDVDLEMTDDATDAILRLGQWRPDGAIFDARVDGLEIQSLCARVAEHDDLAHIRIAVVGRRDAPDGDVLRAAVQKALGTAVTPEASVGPELV